jgi:hypothetical protein
MPHSERAGLSRRTLLQLGSAAGLGFAASALPLGAFGQTAAAPLKIGIIGSGHIGSTVGSLWVKAGHPVMFSSRHPEELAPLVQELGALAKNGPVADAIAFGDVVFIAVPYGAYPQIGKDYGSLLAGKVVLDAGNATSRRDGDEITNEAKEEGIGIVSAKYLPAPASSVRSTPWATNFLPRKPTGPANAWPFRWRATTRKQWLRPRCLSMMPVSIPSLWDRLRGQRTSSRAPRSMASN